jgi:hypothetical protein
MQARDVTPVASIAHRGISPMGFGDYILASFPTDLPDYTISPTARLWHSLFCILQICT